MKMGMKQNDFIIETIGKCFLCLHCNEDNLEWESGDDPSPVSSHLRSIQCLSHYLKIDMSTVFNGDGPVPPQLLTKVRKSKLKVELCEECAMFNDKLSDLHVQLKKIQMEMNSWLQLILVKLNKDWDSKPTHRSQPMTEMQRIFLKRKLEIVEVMRKEVLKKCSTKVGNSFPRVRIQKITKQQENEMEQRKHFGKTKIELQKDPISNIKTEIVANSSPESDYEEDNNLDNQHEDPFSSETSDDDSGGSFNLDACQPKKETNDEETATENNQVYPSEPPKHPRNTGDSLREKCIIDSKTNQHTCRDCSRKFTSFPAFYLHYKAEHLKIRYTCSVCNLKFKQIGNFNRHQKVSHKGTTYKCRDCNQIFSLESNLIKHRGSNGCMDRDAVEMSNLAIVRPVKPSTKSRKIQSMCVLNSKTGRYRCKLCKKELGTKDSFRTHYNMVHLKVKYKCIPCQKEYSRRSGFMAHHVTYHKGLSYDCPTCNKKFQQKDNLKKHLARSSCDHPENGLRRCCRCDKKFSDKSKLDRHIRRVHLKQKQLYRCKECHRVFASSSGFGYHHKTVHLQVKEEVKCGLCEKVFQNKRSYKCHQRNAHGAPRPGSELHE